MAFAKSAQLSGTSWAVGYGPIGGIVAGVIFALAEIVGSALNGGAFLIPFRAFASLPPGTMAPRTTLSTAIPVGAVAHIALSIAYGIVFALLVVKTPPLRASPAVTVIAAIIYGLVL